MLQENEYLQYSQFDNTCVSDDIRVKALPSNSIPCNLKKGVDNVLFVEAYSQDIISLPDEIGSDFQDYISRLPKWQRLLLENTVLVHDAFSSVQIIDAAGEVYATSDGSAPNFRGSFGWAMKTKDGKKIAHNNGPVGGY